MNFQKIGNWYLDKLFKHARISIKTPLNHHKTALAITIGLMIGLTPLLGCTIILATLTGFVFRLNQIILQAGHLILSPVQLLLIYPFIRSGKFIFGLNEKLDISIESIPGFIIHHPWEFVNHYLRLYLAAGLIWFILSLLLGFFIYKIIFRSFKIYLDAKSRNASLSDQS